MMTEYDYNQVSNLIRLLSSEEQENKQLGIAILKAKEHSLSAYNANRLTVILIGNRYHTGDPELKKEYDEVINYILDEFL